MCIYTYRYISRAILSAPIECLDVSIHGLDEVRCSHFNMLFFSFLSLFFSFSQKSFRDPINE